METGWAEEKDETGHERQRAWPRAQVGHKSKVSKLSCLVRK